MLGQQTWVRGRGALLYLVLLYFSLYNWLYKMKSCGHHVKNLTSRGNYGFSWIIKYFSGFLCDIRKPGYRIEFEYSPLKGPICSLDMKEPRNCLIVFRQLFWNCFTQLEDDKYTPVYLLLHQLVSYCSQMRVTLARWTRTLISWNFVILGVQKCW